MISRVVALFEGEEIVRESQDSTPKQIIKLLKMEYGNHLTIKSTSILRNPGIQATIEEMRIPDTIINKAHRGTAYHSR